MDFNEELVWKLRTQTELELSEHLEYWGDEQRWTALLPIVWPLLNSRGFELEGASKKSLSRNWHEHAIAYWSLPIHLLGLGMGWNDIGLGLRKWRETRYSGEYHPILNFIKSMYGDDIEALEVYFGSNHRIQIQTVLSRMAGDENHMSFDFDSAESYTNKQSNIISSRDDLELRHLLTKSLLDGGDALHLETHIAGSFSGNPPGYMSEPPYERIDSPKLIGVGPHIKFVVPKYSGWAMELSKTAELEQFNDDGWPLDVEVDVHIEKLGFIGTFFRNHSTMRWFMFSEEFGVPSQQWVCHEWGHANRGT